MRHVNSPVLMLRENYLGISAASVTFVWSSQVKSPLFI